MPLSLKSAQEIVRRLRHDTIQILKIPNKVTHLDVGRDTAIDICRWLTDQAIVEKWRGYITCEGPVFSTKLDGKMYYLVASKILAHQIKDNRERQRALKFLQADGGLLVQKGRRVLTYQMWVDQPRPFFSRRAEAYATKLLHDPSRVLQTIDCNRRG
jgi:hypothetical protein